MYSNSRHRPRLYAGERRCFPKLRRTARECGGTFWGSETDLRRNSERGYRAKCSERVERRAWLASKSPEALLSNAQENRASLTPRPLQPCRFCGRRACIKSGDLREGSITGSCRLMDCLPQIGALGVPRFAEARLRRRQSITARFWDIMVHAQGIEPRSLPCETYIVPSGE
jgi:hypothetical protein